MCAEVSLYVDSYHDVEAYDGVYVGECAEVSLYVDLYEDLEVYDGCEVVFFAGCLGACVRY